MMKANQDVEEDDVLFQLAAYCSRRLLHIIIIIIIGCGGRRIIYTIAVQSKNRNRLLPLTS